MALLVFGAFILMPRLEDRVRSPTLLSHFSRSQAHFACQAQLQWDDKAPHTEFVGVRVDRSAPDQNHQDPFAHPAETGKLTNMAVHNNL